MTKTQEQRLVNTLNRLTEELRASRKSLPKPA